MVAQRYRPTPKTPLPPDLNVLKPLQEILADLASSYEAPMRIAENNGEFYIEVAYSDPAQDSNPFKIKKVVDGIETACIQALNRSGYHDEFLVTAPFIKNKEAYVEIWPLPDSWKDPVFFPHVS